MQTSSSGATAAEEELQEPGIDDLYPQKLAEQERKLIEDRRRDLGLSETDPQIGIALSGGGIRSATFSLGLFQAFARHDLLKYADYLSTVSGGGYFGGCLGKLFLSAGQTRAPAASAQLVSETLADNLSSPIGWLRENGRYIAPKGSGDYFFAASTYLRNWVAVQYVAGISLLTLFLLANMLRAWAWSTPWGARFEALINDTTLPQFWTSPWLIIPASMAAFVLVPLSSAYWLTQKCQDTRKQASRRIIEWNFPFLGLLLLIIVSAAALVAIHRKMFDWAPDSLVAMYWYAYIVIAGLIAWIFFTISKLKPPSDNTDMVAARNRLSRWLSSALLISVLLTLFGLVDSFGQTLYAISISNTRPMIFTGLSTGALVLLVREFATYLSKDPTKASKVIRLPMHATGLIIGLLLGLIVASFWSAVAHAILWNGESPQGNPGNQMLSFYAPPGWEMPVSGETRLIASGSSVSVQPTNATTPSVELITVAFALAVLISLLTGKTMTFLNLSSIQEFYAARLARAYLGASNARRTGFGESSAKTPDKETQNRTETSVTKVVPHDDVAFGDYRPELHGGPVHLINMTINETVAGGSQLEQRDRRGLGMAVGPCGISVARVHHAVWSGVEEDKQREIHPVAPTANRFRVFDTKAVQVESLSLGQWVAISGAAFSTGLGARTNLGMSLLLGFSNVRIGYWWNSGIAPKARSPQKPNAKQDIKMTDWLETFFSTQLYLSDEFLARFHGPHRQRWYLSDGGHFENTAVYELIRRRLPFIIMSDNGFDQEYTFNDLANLIRKARIDFDAEIRFLDERELDELLTDDLRKVIGTPAELQRQIAHARSPNGNKRLQGEAYSNCHALLARVYYECSPTAGSLLLVIKPSLIGDEPLDLLQYHAEHPEFPQETTLDQFFDEAQWESYRRLGTHIGDSLFGAIPSLEEWIRKLRDHPIGESK